MELGALSPELIWLALAIAGAGCIAGFFAGLLGAGGGAVIVPVLYQLFIHLGVADGVRMHLAVGTSLGVMLATGSRALMAHYRRGAVDMDVLKRWVVWIFLGAATASLLAAHVPGALLRAVFAVITVAVAFKLLLGFDTWRISDEMPRGPLNWAYGFVTGLICTLIGIGGAVFGTTIMTLHGRPIHQAVATSSGIGLLIAIPGAVGFALAGWSAQGLPPFSVGYVSLIGVAILIPATVLMAPLGVRVAHAFKKRTLEIAFGLFMLAVGVRFVASLI